MYFLIFLPFMFFLIDQMCKKWAVKEFSIESNSDQSWRNFLFFSLHKNYGMILGTFKSKKLWIIGSNIVAISVVIIMFIKSVFSNKNNIMQQIGLAFLVGGALSNVYDRLKKGYVVDYFSFKFKKNLLFNLADFFIFFGAILSSIGHVIKD